MRLLNILVVVLSLYFAAVGVAQPITVADGEALPTVFLAGDSTAQNGDGTIVGWGKPFAAFIDPAKAKFVNGARGGRSSRTFLTEGHWQSLLDQMKGGDVVLIQLGMNDGGPVNTDRARGSLPGIGEETQEIENIITHERETVHTYGSYIRRMVQDAKAKGATPILLSLTVRNIWNDGKIERGAGRYGQWMREVAQAERVAFIDLTNLIADRYEQMGESAVREMFPRDHTHTGPAAAAINARGVVAGIKALHRQPLIRLLSPAAREIDPAPQSAVQLARYSRPGPDAPEYEQAMFYNVQQPADPKLPSIWLIGDSTVRNGRGDGGDGLWGWGDALRAYIDPAKANLVNRALGGTGARTYFPSEWPGVLEQIKRGDVVIMQFGHNDNGERGALRGTDEVTEERELAGGRRETVRTFGWYLRKYIADVRAKGATPIVCTLIPRNNWQDGKVARSTTHAEWAREVARSESVMLLDLNELIAKKYDELGEQAVAPLFGDRLHTSHSGAAFNAAVVIEALRALPTNPLEAYLRDQPASTW